MKKLYRVEPTGITDFTRNTLHYRYGNTVNLGPYIHFYNAFLSVIQDIPHVPVDFLISINNQICTLGDIYMQHLATAIDENGTVDLYVATQNPKHKGYQISVKYVNLFIQQFNEINPFVFIDEKAFFWEYFLEAIRYNSFNHLPSRLESTFFFTSDASCDYYLNKHLGMMGEKYEVAITSGQASFEGDMKWLDNIDNSISFVELIEVLNKYWSGLMTNEPVVEVIFQGEFAISKI